MNVSECESKYLISFAVWGAVAVSAVALGNGSEHAVAAYADVACFADDYCCRRG